jgi:hypothetical protein
VVFPNKPESAYLDLQKTKPLLEDAAQLWIAGAVDLYEGDRHLPKPSVVATILSLDSDRSFGSYEIALAHFQAPGLSPETNVTWDQLSLDLLLDYPIESDQSRFSISSKLARLGIRVMTVLRFLPPGGEVRGFEWTGDPGLVKLDPSGWQAIRQFVQLGFEHILSGPDHLLFLLCLVIPLRRIGPLVTVVTAFTLAHSLTLIASAYDLGPDSLWFPPLIETLIAASIVFMALENIVVAGGLRRRWLIAFGFGLVHGFGFSFGLRQTLQFAGNHLLLSLVSFNVGVELGQIAVLVVTLATLTAVFAYVPRRRSRILVIVLSALIADTGWHWMLERADVLRKYQFTAPDWNASTLASLSLWLMLALLVLGCVWVVRGRLEKGWKRAARDVSRPVEVEES